MKNIKKVLFIAIFMLITLFTISTYTKAATVKITGEIVNIRKEASTNSEVIARVSENVECEYIAEKDEWYQVKYKNYTGYVTKQYAKLQGQVSTKQESSNNSTDKQENNTTKNNETVQANTTQSENKKLKQNSTIKILPLVHSSDIGNIKASEAVIVLAQTLGWSYIQTDEISGWVRTSSLEDAKNTTQVNSNPTDSSTTQEDNKAEKKGYISEEEVNMRKGAGTNYSIVKVLTLNTQITILEEKGKWYKVKVGNDMGYVSKDYVSDVAKVTNRSLTEPREDKEDEKKDTTKAEVKKDENKTDDTTTTKTSNITSNQTSITDNKTTTSNKTSASSKMKGTDVVAYAKKYLGHKYVWGGDGSNGTFDCSGFTMYVYKHFGVDLPHYTVAQYNSGKGTKITRQSDLKMGDIVYLTDYVSGEPCGHCGIYISDGKFIHADSTVMKVNISDLNGMYKGRFCGALRIAK